MSSPDDEKNKCYALAIKLLANREHSHFELSHKLAKKGWERDLIDQIVTRLSEQNLQSDLRYAQMLRRSRLNRGYGPIYVRSYLRDKGVESNTIDEVIDFSDTAWKIALNGAAVKKFGTQRTEQFDEKMKQMNFLTRRGFTSDQIRHYYDPNSTD